MREQISLQNESLLHYTFMEHVLCKTEEEKNEVQTQFNSNTGITTLCWFALRIPTFTENLLNIMVVK